jgi:hypothetical protein
MKIGLIVASTYGSNSGDSKFTTIAFRLASTLQLGAAHLGTFVLFKLTSG